MEFLFSIVLKCSKEEANNTLSTKHLSKSCIILKLHRLVSIATCRTLGCASSECSGSDGAGILQRKTPTGLNRHSKDMLNVPECFRNATKLLSCVTMKRWRGYSSRDWPSKRETGGKPHMKVALDVVKVGPVEGKGNVDRSEVVKTFRILRSNRKRPQRRSSWSQRSVASSIPSTLPLSPNFRQIEKRLQCRQCSGALSGRSAIVFVKNCHFIDILQYFISMKDRIYCAIEFRIERTDLL